MSRGTVLRLGSMLMGLVLVGGMMSSLQTRETQARLGALFGGNPAVESPEQTADREARAAELLAKVDLQLLETLDDDTPFRQAEAEAWSHLLAVARETPLEEVRAASAGQITYAQLLAQPDYYRGRVITLVGLAHRVEKIDPISSDTEVGTRYRVIVQPSGTGRLPFTCYCLELPAGFAVGDSPRLVRIDGFFLKNLVYPHELGLDKTPVIVAKTLTDLEETSAPAPSRAPSIGWIVATGAVMALVVALLLRQAVVGSRPLPRLARAAPGDDPATVVATLKELQETHEAEQGE